MAGAKQPAAAPAPPQRIVDRLRAGMRGRARLVIVLALVAAAPLATWGLWRQVRQRVLARDDYRLSPQDIEITPLPEWIRGDLKGEVIRTASLESSLSIVDERLTVRVAQAFGLHPWVAKVQRVYKEHPARVVVELVYREPVAMVEVEQGSQPGLLPVDAEGVVLPTDDFSRDARSREQAQRYPRIAGVRTVPLRPVGRPWGDPLVTGGAQIAAVLKRDWAALGLHHLAPTLLAGGTRPAGTQYDLYTRGGRRIPWGRAPEQSLAGELPAAEKAALLRAFVDRYGSLDKTGSGVPVIDLRAAADRVDPASAIESLPSTDGAR
jgi:hypothetical protein